MEAIMELEKARVKILQFLSTPVFAGFSARGPSHYPLPLLSLNRKIHDLVAPHIYRKVQLTRPDSDVLFLQSDQTQWKHIQILYCGVPFSDEMAAAFLLGQLPNLRVFCASEVTAADEFLCADFLFSLEVLELGHVRWGLGLATFVLTHSRTLTRLMLENVEWTSEMDDVEPIELPRVVRFSGPVELFAHLSMNNVQEVCFPTPTDAGMIDSVLLPSSVRHLTFYRSRGFDADVGDAANELFTVLARRCPRLAMLTGVRFNLENDRLEMHEALLKMDYLRSLEIVLTSTHMLNTFHVQMGRVIATELAMYAKNLRDVGFKFSSGGYFEWHYSKSNQQWERV
ncbi:hypothetical protein CYLTODRAFT_494400 [Cylindrobasidium torrendii FP15055 ss-10]|uniref:Uncharacterized protein n=1 Tax=Cylindrobasidium torrendii FP15055 ss-10 TaxID=1314674 RepID=A0A0D7AWQ3_9AGAR|nr:hypothetical protein CYLTODRAFT_494400 [Cylindrobasidium torrendii FP15055 ss-10]